MLLNFVANAPLHKAHPKITALNAKASLPTLAIASPRIGALAHPNQGQTYALGNPMNGQITGYLNAGITKLFVAFPYKGQGRIF